MNIVWYVIGSIVVILLLFLVYMEIIDIGYIVDPLSLIIACKIIEWLSDKTIFQIYNLEVKTFWHSLLLIFLPVVFLVSGSVICYIIYRIMRYLLRVIFGAIMLIVGTVVYIVVCKCEDIFDDLKDFLDELLDTLSDKIEIVLNKFDKFEEIFYNLKDFLDELANIP